MLTRRFAAEFGLRCAFVFLIFAALFSGQIAKICQRFQGSIPGTISTVFIDSEFQRTVFLCLIVCFTVSIFFYFCAGKNIPCAGRVADSIPWLAFLLFVSACQFVIHNVSSAQALIMLAGAILGQWTAICAKSRTATFTKLGVFSLAAFLASASVWGESSGHLFVYHNFSRWSGPWDNPNLFGPLMGVGIVLATGLALQARRSQMTDGRWRTTFHVGLSVFILILMGRGLFYSYSRGAWFATLCGMVYVIGQRIRRLESGEPALISKINHRKLKVSPGSCSLSLIKAKVAVSVILFSVVALGFWHFQKTNWHPAQRAFSAVNPDDFSWRNRVAAWVGALQIAAEHPWFGAGWNQPEMLYQYYYLQPRLNECVAIELNDYLLLGATLGIPAFFCFGIYLWLSLTRRANGRNENAECSKIDWLEITCRSGAIVLLAGFWFDGGLFMLATASTFWILLELGNMNHHE